MVRAVLEADRGVLESAGHLRPAPEILDALDLHQRLHWAVREAERGGGTAGELDAGVIRERHRALNWLVRFENAAWDDVDTPS